MIDAGCVWDARTALRRAHAFADYRLEWLEEPLRPDDVEGYRWLRDRSPVPIAGGEEECGRESWRPLIDARALDVYQVDVARNGFTDAHYIKQRVEEIGARLCNHCYTSPVTVAASLHWLSTCRDAFLFEDCVEDSPLRHELTNERMQATDGWIEVPDAPGLGVTINEDFVTAHLVAESGRAPGVTSVNGQVPAPTCARSMRRASVPDAQYYVQHTRCEWHPARLGLSRGTGRYIERAKDHDPLEVAMVLCGGSRGVGCRRAAIGFGGATRPRLR